MSLAVSVASEMGCRCIPPALLLALPVLALAAAPEPASAYGLPRPGVVCDKVQTTCYTDKGPSVTQTGREYGRKAQDELLRTLSGRPPMPSVATPATQSPANCLAPPVATAMAGVTTAMPVANVNLNKGVEACFAVPAISSVARMKAVLPTVWPLTMDGTTTFSQEATSCGCVTPRVFGPWSCEIGAIR
jgi:hypothetical protein